MLVVRLSNRTRCAEEHGGAARHARERAVTSQPIRGSGPTISCELTSDDGRSWMKNPTTMCDFCLQLLH